MSTSSVIKNPQTWYQCSLLYPHEVIRDGLTRMVKTLEKIGQLDENLTNKRILKIKKWYQNYFYPFVYHHHHTEESIYFPWLETKAKLPEKLTSNHETLTQLLDEIKDTGDYGILLEKTKSLQTLMLEHLEEEETVVPPILAEHFTEGEEQAIIQKIIPTLGLRGAKISIPWILYCLKIWANKTTKDKFYGDLPLVIRVFYRCSWKRDFKKNNLGLEDIS